MKETQAVIDLYVKRKEERSDRIKRFYTTDDSTQFLVIPSVVNELFSDCSTLEIIYEKNMEYLEKQLSLDYCDDLPFLEPWIGVGVYASAFGSQYLWNEKAAPDTLHRYNLIDEIKGLAYPDWRTSQVMQMVIDSIDLLKERTKGMIPIALTDTQSPQDSATLILDTMEFITSMFTEPEAVHSLLELVTQLIIEFSHVQIDHIGEDLLASPGHGFVGFPYLEGIGVSDDNMVISSPDFNERFSFPYLNRLSREFNGLTLHSCGNWVKSMPKLTALENLKMIDFAIAGNDTDPNPVPAAEAVEALQDYKGIIKVRPGADMRVALDELKILSTLGNKMIVSFPYQEKSYQRYYHEVGDLLGTQLG